MRDNKLLLHHLLCTICIQLKITLIHSTFYEQCKPIPVKALGQNTDVVKSVDYFALITKLLILNNIDVHNWS